MVKRFFDVGVRIYSQWNSKDSERIGDMFGNILKQHRKQVKLCGQLKELTDRSRKEPNNLTLQVRIGDLLTRIGKKQEAVLLYRWTAEKFIEKYYLSEAEALKKVVLRLDPSETNRDWWRNLYENIKEPDKKEMSCAGGNV
jgi:hypothetical protein